MPVDKQVLLRYQVLNKCFRNRYKEYTIDDLVDECNKALRRMDKPDVSKRTEYDKRVIKNLSIKLTERYGTGGSYYKLQHCVRAAYTFSEDNIVYATRTQLNWTHLQSLMSIKDPLERQFYAQMCSIEHWGSIKPFYNKWEGGGDNYLELAQNISRNFTNIKLFRDRVVNKEQCKTM